MDKVIYVREVRTQEKNGRHWLQVSDQDAVNWNIFLEGATLLPDKAYLFTYRIGSKGFTDITKITPLENIFKEQVVREVSSKNEIIRSYSMAIAYSKDLVVADKIQLDDMFTWADKIYNSFQSKADSIIGEYEGEK